MNGSNRKPGEAVACSRIALARDKKKGRKSFSFYALFGWCWYLNRPCS